MFADAVDNLAAGRPWNKTAAEQAQDEADARAEAERAEQERIQAEVDARLEAQREAKEEQEAIEGAQPAPEPATAVVPAFERPRTTNAEVNALTAGQGAAQHLEHLLDYGTCVGRSPHSEVPIVW